MAHPRNFNRVEQAVIDLVPSIEMIRFVNSGNEATMSALRLVQANAGRDKIIKFSGCYHGHAAAGARPFALGVGGN